MTQDPLSEVSAGMRALLEFENEPRDVFAEKVPGASALLWPLARSAVAGAIAAEDVGTGAPVYARPPLRLRVQKRVRRALPNPHSSDRAPRAEHLLVVAGWTKTPTAAGYENWLSDDFAAALGDRAVVVQDAFLDRLSRGNQRPLLSAQTYSYARAAERVTHRAAARPLTDEQTTAVRLAVREYFRLLPFPVTEAAQERTAVDVLGRAARVSAEVTEFSRLLDRVQPRRIHMQTAAYGVRSPQIREAHERGISVSELQHGWIGRSHLAYNFGAVMHTAPMIDHLPDKLLTFGEFWGEGLKFPGELVPVGKPALDREKTAAQPYDRRARRLLFVSTRYAHETLEEVVLALRSALPDDWTFAVRPHPSENAGFAARVPRLIGVPRIEIDPIAHAGASLMASRAVVGFSSTMLYEALAFGCHVAVVESSAAQHYTDAAVFPLRIEAEGDLSHIAEALASPPTATERELAERVWRPDAVAHFLAEAER